MFLVKPSLGLLDVGASVTIEMTLHPKAFEKGLQNFSEKLLLLAIAMYQVINQIYHEPLIGNSLDSLFKDPQ